MQSNIIKKSRYFLVFAFFVFVLLVVDRTFYNVATINEQFVFGLIGNNILAIIISILLLSLMFFLMIRKNPEYYFAFSLLSAGAFSNIIERLVFGGVVDYINIFSIPTFNLADIVIIFALVLIIRSILFMSHNS